MFLLFFDYTQFKVNSEPGQRKTIGDADMNLNRAAGVWTEGDFRLSKLVFLPSKEKGPGTKGILKNFQR